MSENQITIPNDGVYFLVVYIQSKDLNTRFNAEGSL